MDNARKGSGRVSGGIRRTVVFSPDVDRLLRAVGYWDRTTREELVGAAVRFYVAHLEKQRGAPYRPVARGRLGRPIGSGGVRRGRVGA